jgi:hypothetical protein
MLNATLWYKFYAMLQFNQITKKLDRKATKFIISRHKEFTHLTIHEKENLLLEIRNKLEDFNLFVNVAFLISTSLFTLRFLITFIL